MSHSPLKIAFITGTRAEFGLMIPVLRAIQSRKTLKLQIIATGMHLDRSRGYSINQITAAGFNVDAKIPWKGAPAVATGNAIAAIARAIEKLESDMVLIVGDRVEAFAGAVAGHLSGIRVAHIHGGDRAQGQADDSMRHAITKLSHIHFPATRQSAQRIVKLGEDPKWIFSAGSPGNDGIIEQAATWKVVQRKYPGLARREYAVALYHPTDADESVEQKRMTMILEALKKAKVTRTIALYPNTDPGSAGIVRALKKSGAGDLAGVKKPPCKGRVPMASKDAGPTYVEKNLPREMFLGLIQNAAVLVGNSSAGLIESAALGTWTLDIGERQNGREHSDNLLHADFKETQILAKLKTLLSKKSPYKGPSVYGKGDAGKRIAAFLEKNANRLPPLHKLIGY